MAAGGGDGPQYRELSLGSDTIVQKPEDRFGRDAIPEIRSMMFAGSDFDIDEDEDEDLEEEPEPSPNPRDSQPSWYQSLIDEDGADAVEVPAHDWPPSPPQLTRFRMNLTALSQRYNLFFAAFRNGIHVTVPGDVRCTLAAIPHLILKPRASTAAREIRGHLSPHHPHQINHMITGEFGEREILLAAYDDGDVVAYYTDHIASYIQRHNQSLTPSPLREFFHENVGKSAWGLAIHKKSRLVGVSSNLAQATVFAPALAHGRRARGRPSAPSRPFNPLQKFSQDELGSEMRSRRSDWRIVLDLGYEGSNIPNMTFADDDDGQADKVIAVDIMGNTWILDIWKPLASPIKIPRHGLGDIFGRPPRHPASMCWGALVLPGRAFRPAADRQEAMGLSGQEELYLRQGGYKVTDISRSLMNVKNNATHESVMLSFAHIIQSRQQTSLDLLNIIHGNDEESSSGDDDDPDEGEDEVAESTAPDDELISSTNSANTELSMGWWGGGGGEKPGTDKLFTFAGRPDGSPYVVFSGTHEIFSQPVRSTAFLARFTRGPFNPPSFKSTVFKEARDNIPRHLRRQFSIFRTTETDAELFSFDPRSSRILLRRAVEDSRPRHLNNWNLPPGMWERINMLIHVPELNLVVAGSQCGRVGLFILTCAPRGQKPRRTFRLEAVLPTAEDEKKRIRPYVPLYGIAVSPVASNARGDLRLSEARRRDRQMPKEWRLMLYYSNHAVLTYLISDSDSRLGNLNIIF